MDVHLYLHIEDTPALTEKLDVILSRLGTLQSLERHIMASIKTVEALVADLKSNTDAVAAKIDAQTQAIADLKAQIAAGTPVTQEQLDALSAELQPISDHLKAMGSDPANPLPPVPA